MCHMHRPTDGCKACLRIPDGNLCNTCPFLGGAAYIITAKQYISERIWLCAPCSSLCHWTGAVNILGLFEPPAWGSQGFKDNFHAFFPNCDGFFLINLQWVSVSRILCLTLVMKSLVMGRSPNNCCYGFVWSEHWVFWDEKGRKDPCAIKVAHVLLWQRKVRWGSINRRRNATRILLFCIMHLVCDVRISAVSSSTKMALHCLDGHYKEALDKSPLKRQRKCT